MGDNSAGKYIINIYTMFFKIEHTFYENTVCVSFHYMMSLSLSFSLSQKKIDHAFEFYPSMRTLQF